RTPHSKSKRNPVFGKQKLAKSMKSNQLSNQVSLSTKAGKVQTNHTRKKGTILWKQSIKRREVPSDVC
ncbi:MAG: hypothetical protein ACPGUV_11330, partial [Polyangiales bacterium]